MTQTELQGTFQRYLDAFAATSQAEQERLLHSSVAEDVAYTNPGVEGQGLRKLCSTSACSKSAFQVNTSESTGSGNSMGNCCREWTQVGQDGEDLVTAHNYGRLNELGRTAHLAGFWSPGAV